MPFNAFTVCSIDRWRESDLRPAGLSCLRGWLNEKVQPVPCAGWRTTMSANQGFKLLAISSAGVPALSSLLASGHVGLHPHFNQFDLHGNLAYRAKQTHVEPL